VGGDVSIDSEAPVVTSSISRPIRWSFLDARGAHRGIVCVCAFIRVSVCAYTWMSTSVLCFAKKPWNDTRPIPLNRSSSRQWLCSAPLRGPPITAPPSSHASTCSRQPGPYRVALAPNHAPVAATSRKILSASC
jgi:hypothetical protein